MKPPDEGRGGSPSGEDAAAMEPGWDGGTEGAVSYKSRVSEGAGLRDVPPDTQPQVTAESPVPLLEVPAVHYHTKGSDMHKKPT